MSNSPARRNWHGASLAPVLLGAAVLAGPALAAPVTPAPVVAAERAFAADGLALGVRDSFLKHSAPEGIVLAPEPILAKAAFAAPGTAAGLVAAVGRHRALRRPGVYHRAVHVRRQAPRLLLHRLGAPGRRRLEVAL